MAKGDFEAYLEERAKYIDTKIGEYLENRSTEQYMERLLGKAVYKYNNEAITESLLKPAWYLLGLGGKRWRPTLMLLVMEALGKKPEEYIEFAMIPEVAHNATLVHDDIEDSSATRRGAPAVHMKYGVDVALNLGDFLFYFPVAALLDSKKLAGEVKNKVLSIYIREMLRVTTGQATDIAWHNSLVDPSRITEDNYLEMVYDKTGVLASMACQMAGALCGVSDKMIADLGMFGATIGVAFQLQDDVLNLYESKVSSSKGGVGDDITEGKITMLVLHALQKADGKDGKRLQEILKMHTRDRALIAEAIAIITKSKAREYSERLQEKIVKDAWGRIEKELPESEAKRRLSQLAEFLIERNR
jgi:geranylgeranyl diphosphate synthase type 3/geranylgeranyl diphosphate synthase type I